MRASCACDSQRNGKLCREELKALLKYLLPDRTPSEKTIDFLMVKATEISTYSIHIRCGNDRALVGYSGGSCARSRLQFKSRTSHLFLLPLLLLVPYRTRSRGSKACTPPGAHPALNLAHALSTAVTRTAT